MTPVTKEASFPVDYRETQVRQIMHALYKWRSIAILGLAGMGKSNVVRFIISHPQVRARYLQDRAGDFAFAHVDCSSLAAGDATEILAEIAARLGNVIDTPTATDLPQEARQIRRCLEEQILAVEPRVNLVVVLDYFDEVAATLDKSFYNFLFHLRNARPRANLSYVFALRRPVESFYELQDLLDDDCIVGPLDYKDALDSLRRDEARMGVVFDAAQRDKLFACTGGHPGLLKNAAELLADGRVDARLAEGELARELLNSQKIKNLCRQLWKDVSTNEQTLLARLAGGASSDPDAESDRAQLERYGILVKHKGRQSDKARVIFCPLFEAFVRTQTAISGSVRITAVFPNRAHIETAAGEEWVTLPPKLFALFKLLAEAQGQVLQADDIITRIYGAQAAGITDAALSQLVKRLRELLDRHVWKLTQNNTHTCIETVRNIGYRLSTER